MSYVYFAPLKDKSAFKIGKSKIPIERLSALSVFYDFSANDIVLLWCKNESGAFECENIFHQSFSHAVKPFTYDGGTEFFRGDCWTYALELIAILVKSKGYEVSDFNRTTFIKKVSDYEKAGMQMANRFKRKRLELNITQSELAMKCGISRRTVERMERAASCNVPSMIKMACNLKIDNELISVESTRCSAQRASSKKRFVGDSDHEPEKEFVQ